MSPEICHKPTTARCDICTKLRDSDIISVSKESAWSNEQFVCQQCRNKQNKKVVEKVVKVVQ